MFSDNAIGTRNLTRQYAVVPYRFVFAEVAHQAGSAAAMRSFRSAAAVARGCSPTTPASAFVSTSGGRAASSICVAAAADAENGGVSADGSVCGRGCACHRAMTVISETRHSADVCRQRCSRVRARCVCVARTSLCSTGTGSTRPSACARRR